MSLLRAELNLIDPVRLVRLYVWVVGAGLLLDGALLLLVNGLDVPVPVNATDWRYNLLHLVWGIALLAVSVLARDGHDIRVAWAAVIFGAFFVSLGVLGLTIDQPFGLQLGPGENAFHFIVGPVALILGGWALRTLSLARVVSHTGTPAELRNGQVSRRHARRRRGKARRRS
ncbi:MAG: hypothetical protein JO352_04445 [Chloroflexi bacterium]|nr:hypothetical protein [Chloroflexota bacterium]MBV9596557.1 hypothetical protein [Chloroflexota bacterium]